MNNEDRAFGWPQGSVRALLALITVVSVTIPGIILVTRLAAVGDTATALGVFGTLTGLAGGSLGYYFGGGGSSRPGGV